MTRTQTKHKAQEDLMQGLRETISRYQLREQGHEDYSKEVEVEMIIQFKRIEKLLGYEKDSWIIM